MTAENQLQHETQSQSKDFVPLDLLEERLLDHYLKYGERRASAELTVASARRETTSIITAIKDIVRSNFVEGTIVSTHDQDLISIEVLTAFVGLQTRQELDDALKPFRHQANVKRRTPWRTGALGDKRVTVLSLVAKQFLKDWNKSNE